VRILLDTQVWLWMRAAPDRLSARARTLLTAADNELLISAATPWEIAIKVAIGKLELPTSVEEFVATRIASTRATHLPISYVHAIEVASLPMHHQDPFDRVLIAQGRIERVPILTSDVKFRRYDVEVLRAA
jgi:PIN domain nuclease of toxin-antitoxin system